MLGAPLLLFPCISLSTSTLLVNYTAPSPISQLGQPQCEKDLKFITPVPTTGGCYIDPDGKDPTGRPALHFHRDPTYMRSEVHIDGSWAPNQKYYMAYEFMLSNVHEGLWIMQWKKENKSAKPVQNIPFSVGFTESLPTRLAVFYTPPGQKRKTIYTSSTPFTTLMHHRIDLAWDTTPGSGRIEMWVDGERVMNEDGVDIWTGNTAPKVGMYRAEKGSHDTVGQSNVFDNWVYRVVIGNSGWGEIQDSE